MTIKQNPKTKLWEAFYSKRPRGKGDPVSRRRIGLKSKAEALRVEKELVILVEEKLKMAKVPNWEIVVNDFIELNSGTN